MEFEKMNIRRKLLISTAILLLILLLPLLLILSSFDNRLRGVFISDQIKTLEYLQHNNKFSDKETEILEQLYGKTILIIDRYRITQINLPNTIENYPNKGVPLIVKGSVKKFIYFSRSDGDNTKIFIYLLPKPFWDINNIVMLKLQFSEDGFWVVNSVFTIKTKNIREKFKKITSGE